MKKKFTFFLILIFVLGLAFINFSKRIVTASIIPSPIMHWNFNSGFTGIPSTIYDKMGNYNGQNNLGLQTNISAGDYLQDNGWYSLSGGHISCDELNDSGDYCIKTNILPEMSNFTLLYRILFLVNDSCVINAAPDFTVSYNNPTLNIIGKGMSNSGGINVAVSGADHLQYFAFVYNGSGYYFYQNGVLVASMPATNKMINLGELIFGSNSDNISNALRFDEIKIYDVALTEEQVLEEYNYNELISCNADIWECGDWNKCSMEGAQTRNCAKVFDCEWANTLQPSTSQTCVPECIENFWDCSDWSTCSKNGSQNRTCNKIKNCQGGVSAPAATQSCTYTPTCTSDNWSCSDWSDCAQNGRKTRTCNKNSNCEGGISSPLTAQTCIYFPSCTISDWTCSGWSICARGYSQQTRVCIHTPRCQGGVSSPITTQDCARTQACSADTWECGNWGTCSPQGVQTRSCSRTYDCPSAETAAPATSQYCEAPNQPKQQTPSGDLGIINQDAIIKATVKLICPVSSTMASQGSGTVINSTGLILTNKHVIDGTAGCWVGFINNYGDEPYFGDRQIADIYKVSSDADAAVLKLRNPNNKTLTSVNISQSNSGSIKLGEILTTYGYPAKFGTKITYTSGDFSGVDGDYLKTTAIIEHGNSGGGAYLKNGAFIGIPTAVVKGSLNSMGYLLSVSKVNSWLNNSVVYNNNSSNNNYSRVSAMLEDMDLSAISSLGLFIAGDEANIKTATESQKVIAEEKSLITKIDNNLSKRVSGNILLQVEKNGEGWYVNPDNKKKYYLGRSADAFSIMKNLGLGIKHSELANYLNTKFPSRLSGKIVLDVEQNGEAYYINPKDLKGYFLNRPADAFRVMRDLGLGITNNDIRKIDVGEIK